MSTLRTLSFSFSNTDQEITIEILKKIGDILPKQNNIRNFLVEIKENFANYFIEFCSKFREKSIERKEKLTISIQNSVNKFEYL